MSHNASWVLDSMPVDTFGRAVFLKRRGLRFGRFFSPSRGMSVFFTLFVTQLFHGSECIV